MLKMLIPAVLLTALIPNAAPAQQVAHADIHIAYRDLDLRSPAGVKQLDRRIDRAIAAVCPDASTDLARRHMVDRCHATKWADVAPRTNPELAATRPVR